MTFSPSSGYQMNQMVSTMIDLPFISDRSSPTKIHSYETTTYALLRRENTQNQKTQTQNQKTQNMEHKIWNNSWEICSREYWDSRTLCFCFLVLLLIFRRQKYGHVHESFPTGQIKSPHSLITRTGKFAARLDVLKFFAYLNLFVSDWS